MEKKLAVYLLWIVFAAVCALFVTSASGRNYVVLRSGAIIEVDDAWPNDDVIFYEKQSEKLVIEKQATRMVLTGPLKGPKDLAYRLFYYTLDRMNALGATTGLWSETTARQRGWGPVLILLPLVGAGYFLLRRRKDKKEKTVTSDTVREHDPGAQGYRLTGISDIETFFLNIYKIQLGAPRSAPAKIERIQGKKSGPGHIYRLHVRVKSEWKSRAMTIGPLGDGSGRKSQCFYVIFDTHMVIKIPAEPIRDFSDYIQRIRYEGRIVGKLSPRECIIPNVSVIISKIKSLSLQELPLDEIEEKYITFLGSSPKYQEYLKIGNDFAFFMNLSKYYFLSHVMNQLHNTEDQVVEVMTADADLILDYQEFEDKYGEKNGWLCFELQKLYNQFDMGIRQLTTQAAVPVPVDENRTKDWLFTHLAQPQMTPHQLMGLSDNAASEIQDLLRNITKKEDRIVTAYKKLARAYTEYRIYYRNKPKMEGIIANLLVLLAWLGKNNVAMRDLKPDNLLVAGNPDHYPLFLSSADEYAIGLIDLETAVDYRPGETTPPEQPQLGGTPAYATPSHFFQNEIIDHLYHDLPLILNMQDWYATTAIVYEVVTGRRLFQHTAGEISELVRHMQQDTEQEASLTDLYTRVNRRFWKNATAEFGLKVKGEIRWLKSIVIAIPDDMRQQIERHLLRIKKGVEHQIKEQPCAPAETDLPPDAAPDPSSGKRQRLMAQSSRLSDRIHVLGQDGARLPVNDLLEVMFHIVLDIMYPEHRQPPYGTEAGTEPEVSFDPEEDKPDASTGYTVTVALPS